MAEPCSLEHSGSCRIRSNLCHALAHKRESALSSVACTADPGFKLQGLQQYRRCGSAAFAGLYVEQQGQGSVVAAGNPYIDEHHTAWLEWREVVEVGLVRISPLNFVPEHFIDACIICLLWDALLALPAHCLASTLLNFTSDT